MKAGSLKSTVWWATAWSTESGMLVGPGLAKNWRPRGRVVVSVALMAALLPLVAGLVAPGHPTGRRRWPDAAPRRLASAQLRRRPSQGGERRARRRPHHIGPGAAVHELPAGRG